MTLPLVFVDGFDHYSTILQKWSSGSATLYSTGGRIGGGRLASPNNLTKVLTAKQNWAAGFGLKITGTVVAGPIASLVDASNGTQLQLYLTADATLQLRRSTDTILATGTTPLSQDQWYHVEFGAKIDNSAGLFTVRINEIVEIEDDTIDTQATANSTADRFVLNANSTPLDFDDLYVKAGTDDYAETDLYGDVKIATLLPSANGTNTAWTTATGSNHAAMVNEAQFDGDATYVHAGTQNFKDSFHFPDYSGPANVKAVALNLGCRKTNTGQVYIKHLARPESMDLMGDLLQLLDSFAFYQKIYETVPGTSDAWTVEDLDACEFGIQHGGNTGIGG